MTAGDPILLPESPAGAPVEGLREAEDLKSLLDAMADRRATHAQYIQRGKPCEAIKKRWDAYLESRAVIESLFSVLRDERDEAREENWDSIDEISKRDAELAALRSQLSGISETALTPTHARELLQEIGSLGVSHPHFRIASAEIITRLNAISNSRSPETERKMTEPTVRFLCHGCGKSVTSPLPRDAVMRAIAWCPECIEAGHDQYASFTQDDIEQVRRLADARVSYDRHELTAEGRAHIRNIADRMEKTILPPPDSNQ